MPVSTSGIDAYMRGRIYQGLFGPLDLSSIVIVLLLSHSWSANLTRALIVLLAISLVDGVRCSRSKTQPHL